MKQRRSKESHLAAGVRKNEEFELEITDLSGEGLGIGKRDGFVWFVKDTVIGDRVRVGAMKAKKNYGFARLIAVLHPSEHRVESPCPISHRCGGCQLMDMSYEAQLRFKEEKVYHDMLRIGGVEESVLKEVFRPIVGLNPPIRYRNKAQFPISTDKSGKLTAGFYAGRTHAVIPCEDCLLGVPENRILLQAILSWAEAHKLEAYDEETGTGLLRHVLLRKGFYTGDIMVCLVINGETLPYGAELTALLTGETLRESLQKAQREEPSLSGEAGADCRVRSISFSVNQERSNVIMGKKIVNLYGEGFIEDKIGDVLFRISPLSFFQVNPVQTREMYGLALEYAGLTGQETVWDMYCGIGTISLFLSQRAKKVYGVEIVPEAIADARRNAALNGIDNAEFFVGAAEEVLPKWYAENPTERIDVVCVDPPRKGLDPRALETIVKMSPDRLVYVSCDPATLARDVRFLREQGYELRHVRPVDNFGNTVHVETVVLLSKGIIDSQKVKVEMSLEDMDMSGFKKGATYEAIKDYVKEQTGYKVSSLYIAQVKAKHGLDMRENFNLPKSEDARQPKCPPEKEKAIEDALRHFQMI